MSWEEEKYRFYDFIIENKVIGFFDEDKLQKIFLNLISNAIKFTEAKGEIVILVSEEHPPVSHSQQPISVRL